MVRYGIKQFQLNAPIFEASPYKYGRRDIDPAGRCGVA
jgi:hypothetical protein